MRILAPSSRNRLQCEGGFTLTELLIAISVILLLTLIAIPNLPGVRMEANENSAIASIRSIYSAEVQFSERYPAQGFACSLAQLGGKVGSGAPSPVQAQVLESVLAEGQKSGYLFKVAECSKNAKGEPAYTGFQITAVPKMPGRTGHRGFCIDQTGEAKADPTGGILCTQSLQ